MVKDREREGGEGEKDWRRRGRGGGEGVRSRLEEREDIGGEYIGKARIPGKGKHRIRAQYHHSKFYNTNTRNSKIKTNI